MSHRAHSGVSAETLAVFDTAGEPLSTSEVADALGLPHRTAYKRLATLADRGDVQTKKVGANARVWWRPASDDESALDTSVFREVFEEAFDAIILADDSGSWVEVNPAASELFGLPREELLGKTPASFAPEGYDVEAAWAEFVASDRDRGLFPLVRADGEERLAEFAATPNVRPGLHLSILRDVTEREATAAELARLNHLNTILRGIDRAATRTDTRAALAADICDSLLASDYYQYAALCVAVHGTEVFEPLATTGRDDLTTTIDTAGLASVDPDAASRAVETEAVQVERTPSDGDDPTSWWLATLTDHGVRSVAVVPLGYDGVVYGVLGIATSHREAFDAEERAILEELGHTIGYAFDTLEQHHTLLDQGVLAVTLCSRALVAPLAALTDVEGATVTLDQLVPLPDGLVSYYTLEGIDPDSLLVFLESADLDVDARILGQVGDTAWFEFRGYESPAATLASEFGGRIVRATIEHGVIEFVVEVPAGTDIRALLAMFEQVAPDVSVVAQEHRPHADPSIRDVFTAYGEALTDRQRTALQLAVFSGYFEWPRRTTGAQLAALLDVHPSTFHYHLRLAERKLFDALFADGDDSLDSV